MSEKTDRIKQSIVNLLHSLHDSTLEMQMNFERLLKLFGEDMTWYEEWRKTRPDLKNSIQQINTIKPSRSPQTPYYWIVVQKTVKNQTGPTILGFCIQEHPFEFIAKQREILLLIWKEISKAEFDLWNTSLGSK